MLGFVLFVFLMIFYSYLFGSSEQGNCESPVNCEEVFPEDIFQLLDVELG